MPDAHGSITSVGAAVDIGSNSVHLLVAQVAGHELTPLMDTSTFLGLGDAVHDGSALGAEGREQLTRTLVDYAAAARNHGATAVTFLGTEPLRRAADAARIVAQVEQATDAPLPVLSHEEEACLNLVGVTGGRVVHHRVLAVDIGGGSSEFALVAPDGPAVAFGLRLGSARLTAGRVRHDPPTRAELDAIREAAAVIVGGAETGAPDELVGVGGTASNLLKLLRVPPPDRVLTREALDEVDDVLTSVPAAMLPERYLVNPVRARLLPAGSSIVRAILDRFGLDRMRISAGSLREGTVLVVDHAGPSWRDRLPELARGWRA